MLPPTIEFEIKTYFEITLQIAVMSSWELAYKWNFQRGLLPTGHACLVTYTGVWRKLQAAAFCWSAVGRATRSCTSLYGNFGTYIRAYPHISL